MKCIFQYCLCLIFYGLTSNVSAKTFSVGIAETLPIIKISKGEVNLLGVFEEIANCIETKIDHKLLWKQFPSARLLLMIEKGKLDLAYPMGFTLERNSQLQPSEWVAISHDYWAFVNKPETFDDINLWIAVKFKSPQDHYVTMKGYKNIRRVHNYQDLVKLLINKRVDMIALPSQLFELLFNKHSNVHFYSYLERETGFYMKKNVNKEWLTEFNNAIKSCRKSFY